MYAMCIQYTYNIHIYTYRYNILPVQEGHGEAVRGPDKGGSVHAQADHLLSRLDIF